MKAEKLLMKKNNPYWTPCAAHCIDLMFEDIGKRDNVAQLIKNSRKITNFIYNHGSSISLMFEDIYSCCFNCLEAYAITLSFCINTQPRPCLEASQYNAKPSCPDGSVSTGAEVNLLFSSSKLF